MIWRSFIASAFVAAVVAACSVDSSLTCGATCVDGAPADGSPADGSPADGSPADGSPADGPVDSTTDAPSPSDSSSDATADVACTVTCPNGTTCDGAFCNVPQGATCGGALTTSGGSASFDGTVCAGTGPTITTTCTSPLTASATFIHFTSGGDPWSVTVTAVDGPLQVEVMSSSCSTGSACYDLAKGASKTFSVNAGTVVAIVNASGCTKWQLTYTSI